MKRILSAFAFAALVSTFATAQQATTPATATPEVAVTAAATAKVGGPVMTFEKTEIDYGTIAQGADPLRRFKFKNTGTEPLVIKNARGSCGCTVPSFKKEPIAPGETSEIEVRYDTQRVGDFSKSVTIETNEGEQARVLMIKGHVNEKVAEAGVPVNAPSLISAPKQ
jgi:ABC-type transport system substrate-binding protein